MEITKEAKRENLDMSIMKEVLKYEHDTGEKIKSYTVTLKEPAPIDPDVFSIAGNNYSIVLKTVE